MNEGNEYVRAMAFYYEDYDTSNYKINNIEEFNINRQTADPSESQEFIINDLQLAKFKISDDIEGLEMNVGDESCVKMMYFMSQSDSIVTNFRKEMKGMVDVVLAREEHDVSPLIVNTELTSGKVIDLNKDLKKIRTRFDPDAETYIYLFCPFVKNVGDEEETKNEFKISFSYQENTEYDAIGNKDYLKNLFNNEIRKANLGIIDEETTTEELDLFQKVRQEIILSPNSKELVDNILNLKNKFSGVVEEEIDITNNLRNDDGFVVQMVINTLYILIVSFQCFQLENQVLK